MRARWGIALLLLAACTRGGDDGAGERDSLTPQFSKDFEGAAADTTTTTVAGGRTTTTASAGAGAGGTTTTTAAPSSRPPGQVAAPVVPGATAAAIVDREGDLTPSPADRPPPWADLLGGTLVRRADGFELRVRLGGGSAPTTTDEDHTMNVASFYDVDGDGGIDYEVWANLAARGWGVSWFDNDKERGYFGEKTGVVVTVERDEVVLRFPLARLGGAERFRWSLASEWGRYEVLGTSATARDDAPDFDAAARFPG